MRALGFISGPVVNLSIVDKGITTLAININLNFYIEHTTKNYTHYKHITHFQKNITNITNRTKNCWQSVMRQRKEKATKTFSCVKERENC